MLYDLSEFISGQSLGEVIGSKVASWLLACRVWCRNDIHSLNTSHNLIVLREVSIGRSGLGLSGAITILNLNLRVSYFITTYADSMVLYHGC